VITLTVLLLLARDPTGCHVLRRRVLRGEDAPALLITGHLTGHARRPPVVSCFPCTPAGAGLPRRPWPRRSEAVPSGPEGGCPDEHVRSRRRHASHPPMVDATARAHGVSSNDVGVTLTDGAGEMNAVIVGGAAAGTSPGARLRRLDESAEIVVLERDHYVWFENCGLPYHTGGAIPDRDSLLLQTPESPRNLRLSHPPGAQPPVGQGPVHPAFGQGPGGGLGRDRHLLPPPARPLPGQWPGVEPNVLTVGLTEPWVRLSTALNGPGRTAGIRQLQARPAPPRFTACAHLIPQMLTGDPVLFIGDEAEEAWRILGPRHKRVISRRRPPAGKPSRPRGPCGRGSGRDDPRDRQGRRGSTRGKVMM
jgi:hypothetical protein